MKTLVIAIVVWAVVMLFAPGKRRVDDGDEAILTYKAAFRWVGRLCWIFPVVIAIIGIVDPPNKGEGWIVFALIGGFAAIALPATLELERRRIILDSKGITQESAWSRPLTIAWPEVRDVKIALSGGVVISSRTRKVGASLYLDGMATLADALEEHAGTLKSVPPVVARLRGLHARYAGSIRA